MLASEKEVDSMVTVPHDLALCVATRQQETAAVVSVAGEVDTTNAHLLHAAIVAAIDRRSRVVVDLTAVGFTDSMGLVTLVRGLTHAAARGTALRLVVTDPHLERTLAITGLQHVFAIYQDPHAAARSEK